MGMIAVDSERSRKAALFAAASLALGGLVAVTLVDGGVTSNARRMVQPVSGAQPGTSWLEAEGGSTTTSLARRRTTWRSREYLGLPRTGSTTTTTAPPNPDPTPSRPTAQFDVAVPAAGAQASAGEGDGSCTTVQVTALTPEGCPPPSGDGPVVVGYQAPGGNGPLVRASFA